MATSATEIANLALSHLGISTPIQDLDTEQTKEASACREFYAQSRDELLREFSWPFATRRVALALVETLPTDEWGYSYRYPSDAVSLSTIDHGLTRFPTAATRVPHRIVADATGRLLYTDQASPTITYTERVTDVTRYPPDFTQALAFLLAAYIAPRVAGADQLKLSDRAFQLYRYTVLKAKSAAANESVSDVPPESEFISVRE